MPVSIWKKRIRGSWEGVFCSFFIILCWLYSTYCAMFVIILHFIDEPQQAYIFYGYFVLAMFTLASQYDVINSSPGIVYSVSQATADTYGWSLCALCEKYKIPRSHHCLRCGKCIRKMDHHCIWVNNCIGEDNMGKFIRFLLYACSQSILTLLLCIMYYLSLFPECYDCLLIPEEERNMVRLEIFGVFIISIWLFGFTFTLFINRMLLIAADLTTIEMLQNKSWLRQRLQHPGNPGPMKHLSKVFGGKNILNWFIPLARTNVTPSYDQGKFEPNIFNL